MYRLKPFGVLNGREVPVIELFNDKCAVELLPGQYDQREDFAEQCIQLITQKERPMVAAAKVYVLEGKLTAEEVEKIMAYCINPIEAREAEQAKPETLISTCEEPEKVKSVTGFLTMSKEEAEALRQSMGLAMSLDDLLWCQKYFNEEHREPTITEIRVLDTYWSDHCRHTTFMTQIEDVDIVPGTFTQIGNARGHQSKDQQRDDKTEEITKQTIYR